MNAATRVGDVVKCADFKGFGALLFPPLSDREDRRRTLDQIAPLFRRQSNVRTEETLRVLNYIQRQRKRGEKVFYGIYSPDEKRKTPSKSDVGLYFFRGVCNGPTALFCPGGGFEYVSSLHESLPEAIELTLPGCNAFSLHYRTESLAAACEDLAAAISYVFAHSSELGVSTEGYSLWGAGTGADIAAYLASYGTHAFGGDSLPRASMLVMQYSSHANYTFREPPTFACVGDSDAECSWQAMKTRIDSLSARGIDTEFHVYHGVGHGFGLGTDTPAEGWFPCALAFWKRHLPPNVRRLLRRRPAVRPFNAR